MAGFLSRLGSFFSGKRAAPAGSGVQLIDGVAPASMSGRGSARRGTRELLEAHRTSPWLRAVVTRIARGVASAGWTVYARAEEPAPGPSRHRAAWRDFPAGRARDVVGAPLWRWGKDRLVVDRRLDAPDPLQRARYRAELASAGLLREVPDHPLLSLLAEPNLDSTGRACLEVTQKHLDIKGESFWLLKFNDLGVPVGYVPLPAHWVSSVPTEASPWFQISAGGIVMRVKSPGVVWFRDLDPANPYGRGTGIAESLGDELDADESAAKYLAAWFENSATPSILVSFEGASEPELRRAKEKWDGEHRGVWNAHRAHFSSGKMNALRLDSSFRDQQIYDLRRLNRDTVAQVFGLPPEIIGIIENSNRSTISAARHIYALGVEFPRVEFLRAEIQRQLLPLFPGSAGAVLEAEVAVPEDEQRRLDVFRAMPGAFSLNEWRSEAGYDPEPQFAGVFPPLALPGQVEPNPATIDDDDLPEEPESETEIETEPERSDPPWARATRLRLTGSNKRST